MLDVPEEKPDGAELRAASYAALTCRAATENARALVDHVYELVLATETRERKRGHKQAADFKVATEAFLGDLLQAAGDTSPWVYRSVGRSSFTGDVVTYRTFDALRSGLRSLGLTEEVKDAVRARVEFDPGRVTWSGWAPRFKATPKLIKLAASYGVSLEEACDHFILALPKKPLVLHDSSRMTMKIDRTSPDVQALEQTVAELNAFLEKFSIKGGSHRGYIRVFNEGDHPSFAWNKGGRLYSQESHRSYQSLSSGERLKITIDGEPVCELDIRASHLTIFHARRGQPLDQSRDPYALLGPGEEAREVMKWFVTITFGNSQFPRRWSSEMTQDFHEQTGRKLGRVYPISMVRDAVARAYPLLGALKKVDGKPGVWAELQYVESEAILKTMVTLKAKGIPSLSVHDSLIVQERHEATATGLLRSIYKATTKATPVIRSKRATGRQA